MGRINGVFHYILKKINGSYRTAVKMGMKVGSNIRVMGGVEFGSEPYLIELGSDITLAFNVHFITHDGGTWAFRDLLQYQDVFKYGKIVIGDRTFVGGGTIILPGVKIGNRCVIGAGTVVTKSIPDGSVAVGIPAKIICTTKEYAEKCKSQMKPYDKREYMDNKRDFLLKYLNE